MDPTYLVVFKRLNEVSARSRQGWHGTCFMVYELPEFAAFDNKQFMDCECLHGDSAKSLATLNSQFERTLTYEQKRYE